MRIPALHLALSTIAMLGLATSSGASDPNAISPLDRLRNAIEAHPTDPDLRWAYARNLATEGRAQDALTETRAFLAKWPGRRPGARTEIARMLLEQDAVAEAASLLDDELAAQPRHAIARFYRGLAFRRQGLVIEANREFEMAGRLEPTIRAETLLARALGLFDLGFESEAVDLLRMILETDPTGDTAVRARLLLRQREVLDLERSYRLDAYAGIEYDDNVTLENAESEIAASGRNDFRWVWGAGGTLRPLVTEKASVTLGYRYDQTSHIHQDDFDVLGNTLFASGAWSHTDKLAFRLDGIVTSTLQDLDHELLGGVIRPGFVYSFGPRWGATRGFFQFEVSEYDDDALFSAWERDALIYSLGVEHFVPLPLGRSWLSISAAWARTRTQAETFGTSAGFDGDFDYDSVRLRSTAMLELPYEIRLQVDTAYTHDRYLNDNFSHFLATGSDRKRRDDLLSGRLAISREIVAPIRFEMYWRGTRRLSNVRAFDYDKQLVGAVLRLSTD